MYVIDDSIIIVTVMYVPIRPGRRDPEIEEMEDLED